MSGRWMTVFLQLKTLLEPFGITRYYTDGWGAYERHLDPEQHTVGQGKHPENREQAHQLTDTDQALGTPHDLLLQDDTDARSRHRALHQSVRVWASSLTRNQQI